MGMHFGILAASCPWPTLLAALRDHAGALDETNERLATAERDTDSGFLVEAGDLNGRSYVIDSSFMLSGGEVDLIVTLSRVIPGTTVGCVAETVSGTFILVAAERGQLRRWFHHCHAELAEPFEMGERLPCEAEAALDEGPEALFAALKHFGYAVEAFIASDDRRAYRFDPLEAETGSDLSRAFDEHRARSLLSEDERPEVTVARSSGRPSAISVLWRWILRRFGSH